MQHIPLVGAPVAEFILRVIMRDNISQLVGVPVEYFIRIIIVRSNISVIKEIIHRSMMRFSQRIPRMDVRVPVLQYE
jgi:hypothetical protein